MTYTLTWDIIQICIYIVLCYNINIILFSFSNAFFFCTLYTHQTRTKTYFRHINTYIIDIMDLNCEKIRNTSAPICKFMYVYKNSQGIFVYKWMDNNVWMMINMWDTYNFDIFLPSFQSSSFYYIVAFRNNFIYNIVSNVNYVICSIKMMFSDWSKARAALAAGKCSNKSASDIFLFLFFYTLYAARRWYSYS